MRELWRLRLNFFVLLVLSFTGGIGYSAVLSSLHQFVINPTVEELNGTVKVHTQIVLPTSPSTREHGIWSNRISHFFPHPHSDKNDGYCIFLVDTEVHVILAQF